MPQQKIQDTQFGKMAGFASTTCITPILLLFLLYVLVSWIGWSTIADQAVGLLFLLYVLVLYTYTTTYTCMLNWMINFCSPGCLHGWRCLWIQTRQRIRPKNCPKLKHTSSLMGATEKNMIFWSPWACLWTHADPRTDPARTGWRSKTTCWKGSARESLSGCNPDEHDLNNLTIRS